MGARIFNAFSAAGQHYAVRATERLGLRLTQWAVLSLRNARDRGNTPSVCNPRLVIGLHGGKIGHKASDAQIKGGGLRCGKTCSLCHSRPMPIAVITSPNSR